MEKLLEQVKAVVIQADKALRGRRDCVVSDPG